MSVADLAAIERKAGLTGAVTRAQARTDQAQYMHDHYVPALQALLTAWEAIPNDPSASGYMTALNAFIATTGSDTDWLKWPRPYTEEPSGTYRDLGPAGQLAIVNAKIAAISAELASANADLAATQAALAAG